MVNLLKVLMVHVVSHVVLIAHVVFYNAEHHGEGWQLNVSLT